MDKSLLKEPKIKKKVHACTTKQGVKVYAVWYDEQINNIRVVTRTETR